MRLSFLCFSLLFSSFLPANENLDQLIQQSVSQGYHEEFIDLVEMIYGKGFLSQGGTQSIERMIARTTLDNRHILDIGSGLGGPTLYLAEHYPVDIVGLEPQQWLWKRAVNNLTEKQKSLKGTARFVLMENPANLSQFADASFDLVMSRETILHIPLECKKVFFSEINRVLKPGGELIILDWMRNTPAYSEKTRKMMEMDGIAYHLMTSDDYHAMLEDAGFSPIDMENISAETAQYSQGNIDKIQELSSTIQKQYGSDVLDYCIESWGYQRDAFASEEFVAGIFRTKK